MSHMIKALAGHEVQVMYVLNDRARWAHLLRFWHLRSVSRMDLSGFDLVITLQPDSHCIRHHNHVVYFQHHLKQYYDLFWQTLHHRKGARKKIVFPLLALIARAADMAYMTPNLKRSHVLVNSKTVGKRLEKYNRISSYAVIHPGCQITPVSPAREKAGSPTLLSFSRLNVVQKGLELILQTAPLVPSCDFIIAGPHDPTIDAVDRSTLSANVKIVTKEFSEQEKEALFDSCDVFLAPYVEEDFGITPIEANAHGKPVAYCDNGGEIVFTQKHKETGFMCHRNPQEFAAAIDYCVRNAGSMRAACMNNAVRYSWAAFEGAFSTYIENLSAHAENESAGSEAN